MKAIVFQCIFFFVDLLESITFFRVSGGDRLWGDRAKRPTNGHGAYVCTIALCKFSKESPWVSAR